MTQTSRVILVLVEETHTPLNELTEQKIQSMFVQFGPIKAVKIFERSSTWKTFVEFREFEGHKNALAANPKDLSKFYKVKVYPSKKKFVAKDIEAQNPKKKKPSDRPQNSAQKLEKGEGSTNLPDGPDQNTNSPLPEPRHAHNFVPTRPIFALPAFTGVKVGDNFQIGTPFDSNTLKTARAESALPPSNFPRTESLKLEKKHSQRLIRNLPLSPTIGSDNNTRSAGYSHPPRVIWISPVPTSASEISGLIRVFSSYGPLVRVMSNPANKSVIIEFSEYLSVIEASKALRFNQIFPRGVCFKVMSHQEVSQILDAQAANFPSFGWETHFCDPRVYNCVRPFSLEEELILVVKNVPRHWTEDNLDLLLGTVRTPLRINSVKIPVTGEKLYLVDFATNNDVSVVVNTLDGQWVDGLSLRISAADRHDVLAQLHEQHMSI